MTLSDPATNLAGKERKQMFEAQRKNVDQRIDDLVFAAYDSGWNSAVEILQATVRDKEHEGDQVAVEVLKWALTQFAEGE